MFGRNEFETICPEIEERKACLYLIARRFLLLIMKCHSFLKDLMEASGTPITASKRQESLVHTHAAKESGDTEVTGHVQV